MTLSLRTLLVILQLAIRTTLGQTTSLNNNACEQVSLNGICIELPVIQLSTSQTGQSNPGQTGQNTTPGQDSNRTASLVSTTKLYFPSNLFPSDIQLDSQLTIDIIHSTFSQLARWPCAPLTTITNATSTAVAGTNQTTATTPTVRQQLRINQNLQEILLSTSFPSYSLTRVNNYISMVSLDFAISKDFAVMLLAALQDASLSNSFAIRISDAAKRQCLVGPTVLGQTADSVSLDVDRIRRIAAGISSAPSPSATPIETSLTTPSPTQTTTSDSSSNSTSSSTNFIRILVLSLVGGFILISTILALCLYRKRKDNRKDMQQEDPNYTREKGDSIYSSDEIATRHLDSFRLPSLSSLQDRPSSDLSPAAPFPYSLSRQDIPTSIEDAGFVASANLDSSLRSSPSRRSTAPSSTSFHTAPNNPSSSPSSSNYLTAPSVSTSLKTSSSTSSKTLRFSDSNTTLASESQAPWALDQLPEEAEMQEEYLQLGKVVNTLTNDGELIQ